MKVSLSWLNEYVPLFDSAEQLAEKLTMAGLEVDTVEDRFRYLHTVKVGRVETVRPHPDADKLKICSVSTGTDRVEVVCGAPNVDEGQRVPLAIPGTVLPDGREIKQASLRGVTSNGMICSQAELELGSDHSGIWVLPENVQLGASLAEALDLSDHVLDIDLTPNRPDCLSIIGVAREIAAFSNQTLTCPDTTDGDEGRTIQDKAAVTLEDPDLCPRYAARLIEDITVGPSPDWLQDRLRSVDQRPINNIVDITNFVMLEMGQPLHAFDFDRLAGQRIVVRRARPGEMFISLDNKERRLHSDMLMICDAENPVAIGGVMGGLNSEVEPTTTHVLLESACFNPISIRKTAKQLGLHTEASHRFERGVDPDGTLAALNRAAHLVAELGRGRLVAGTIDAHPGGLPIETIKLSVTATNRLLGTTLDRHTICRLLSSIAIKTETAEAGDDQIIVTPPSFRVDLTQPEDLMEEVARTRGYNRIPTRMPYIAAGSARPNPLLKTKQRLRQLMTGQGFTETVNYSFISAGAGDALLLGENDSRRRSVKILNPLTEDQGVMRTTLIPGLLETMERNLAQQVKSFRCFELGKVFIDRGKDDQPDEEEMLAGLWTGMRTETGWYGKAVACDFFDIKGTVESLFQALQIRNVHFRIPEKTAAPYLRDGVAAAIVKNDRTIGFLGELAPDVARRFDLKQSAFVFEFSVMRMQDLIPDRIKAQPIPKFPSIARDITLIVPHDLAADTLPAHIHNSGEPLVGDVRIFDVFSGPPIPTGKKSLSVRVTYRSSESTLEDEAVNTIHRRLTAQLLKVFQAQLPT
ncbi:MAG: phenylalanine--tRNA ligase subunit beta [Desulfosarcina sp.]|nr:phenylalanine--tRNA ligase subunit beta [Desulfobacterales bacterium]